MKIFLPVLILAALLVGCSSRETKKRDDLSGKPMSRRIDESLKRMQNPNDRSIFDKDRQASLGGNRSAGWFSRQKYGARDYNGVKSYSTDQFATREFSRAGESSRLSRQTFSGPDTASNFGDQAFATSQSAFGDRTSDDTLQEFRSAGDVFKTRPNSRALKSQKQNLGPRIIELEEQGTKPAYTENEVRRLMGRD
jgi:hypothetical protein